MTRTSSARKSPGLATPVVAATLPTPSEGPHAALQQAIVRAIAALDTPGGLSDKRVHAARRALKHARAALRVVRRTMTPEDYRQEEAVLRGAARAVGALRDAHVLAGRFQWLQECYSRERAPEDLAPFRITLDRSVMQARNARSANAGGRREVARELEACARRLQLVVTSPMDSRDMQKSVRRIYRAGRRTFKRAQRHPQADALHRWRKQVKYFADGISSIGVLATPREHEFEHSAWRLAKWLGEDHDLVLLTEALHASKPAIDPAACDAASRIIAERQERLRRRSLRLGSRLFAPKPRRAVHGLARSTGNAGMTATAGP